MKFSEMNALKLLNKGLADEDVAAQLDRTADQIAELRAKFIVDGVLRGPVSVSKVKMSGETRAQRRIEIVKWLEANPGKTRAEAAVKYGVGVGTVDQAVREHGTQKRDFKRSTQDEILAIAAMMVRGERDTDIAAKVGLSRERIRLIREDAEAAGLFAAVKDVANAVRAVAAK